MLSASDNELLTRVGPGTPTGDLLRQFWIPALLSSELPGPDGPPLRHRLLGEDLIAFRTTSGQVGLVGSNCPHRGASLFFGRNEEEGLRCVYHGWKFDVAGNCVDMPNEPAESNFKHKIHHVAYPCVERHGVIWTYMGPSQPPPPLPQLEWNMVPEGHYYYSLRLQECNWVQALEGEIDSSHAAFIHSKLNRASPNFPGYMELDKTPRFQTIDTPYGVAIASRRNGDAGRYYWRVNQYVMPFYTLVPPAPGSRATPDLSGHAWVPMDDFNTMCLCFNYSPDQPLSEKWVNTLRYGTREGRESGHPNPNNFLPETPQPGSRWRSRDNRDNDWNIDREQQRQATYVGLNGLWQEDSSAQVTMGTVYDRSREHLGTSDTGIIQARRRLMRAAKALREQGELPPAVHDPSVFRVRAVSVLLPKEVSWLDGAMKHSVAEGDLSYLHPKA